MNLRCRVERLETAAADILRERKLSDSGPEMSNAQLAETIARFLCGESWEEIARSQGRPWNPPDHSVIPLGTDDDLREAILRLFVDLAEKEGIPLTILEDAFKQSDISLRDVDN